MTGNLFNIQKFSLHDGFGIRTTVFFQGCNLRCAWCSNPESQPLEPPVMEGKPAGRSYTLEEVLKEVLADKAFYDKSGGGVTLSGGEPLLQPEFAFALLDGLHAQGVSVGMETAALIAPDTWRQAVEKLDFLLVDCKHWDSETHQAFTGVPNERILENIAYALAHGKRTIVRIPLIPGFNNSQEDAAQFAALFTRLKAGEVHLLPYHSFGESKYKQLGLPYAYENQKQLHPEDVAAFQNVLTEAGFQVQIGG